MKELADYKSLWMMAAMLAAVLAVSPARSSVLTYDLTTCQIGGGCGSSSVFGTVTVSTISSTEVSVDMTLASGEVFAFGGAGQPLLFNVTGDPSVSITNLTSNVSDRFAFNNSPMFMADGTGKWDYYMSCSSCGTGTSMSTTGPDGAPVSLSFDVTLASGINPSSFSKSTKGFTFATDVGIPNGSGGYMTGDVGAINPVPLPPSLLLLASALVALGLMLCPGGRRPDGRTPARHAVSVRSIIASRHLTAATECRTF